MTVVISSNRSRPRPELRSRIFDAAIAVFRERGYERATIEAITARAGVAKGTFFNFYPSKLDVILDYHARLDTQAAEWRAALDPARPAASLRAYAVRLERMFRDEGDLLVDLVRLTFSVPALRELDEASRAPDVRQFAAFVERAMAAGTVRRTADPDMAGEAIADLWSGAVRHWIANRASSLADLFWARLDLLFRGLEERR